ncbi:hypothetical protein RND81_08G148000 [Saponaria officinalis]|uniref:TF-B3 domain-containing protein n=1 Tax=Saponaria officinalis TaxID=3572 RepID=A0AAW1J7G3_SAPOF
MVRIIAFQAIDPALEKEAKLLPIDLTVNPTTPSLSRPLPQQSDGRGRKELLPIDLTVNPTIPSPSRPPLQGGGRGRRGNPNTPVLENQTPPLPRIFFDKIEELGGFLGDQPRLLFAKRLFTTDVDKNQYRVSMPVGQCKGIYLTPEEMVKLTMKVAGKYVGIDVDVIQPANGHEVTGLSFKKYELQGVNSFVFGGQSWNTFVKNNQLEVNNFIQVWHFRLRSNFKLCFAIVKLEP